MDDALKVFFLMTGLVSSGAVAYLGVVLIGALARRLNPPPRPDDSELGYLREQVEGLDLMRERLAELENRMDFAERVLPRPEGRSVND